MTLEELAELVSGRRAAIKLQQVELENDETEWVVWLFDPDQPAVIAVATDEDLETAVNDAVKVWDETESEAAGGVS